MGGGGLYVGLAENHLTACKFISVLYMFVSLYVSDGRAFQVVSSASAFWKSDYSLLHIMPNTKRTHRKRERRGGGGGEIQQRESRRGRNGKLLGQ